jgi:hypothetical protein
MIVDAEDIINEFIDQGFKLTLRQLYYQFVARGLIENTERSYKNLGNLINKARMAGLLDWDAIEDRTRNIEKNSHWSNPQEIIRTAAKSFQLDKWKGQDFRAEVWIEKEALVSVIEDVCSELDVTYLACRGYMSQSEMYVAAKRLIKYNEDDLECVIVHLGDLDPSGIDMTRDIEDRLLTFGADVEVRRIALNRDQIDLYNPPPNPAKVSDTRYEAYCLEHGDKSWELDALKPGVIVDLIRDEVEGILDIDMFNDRVEEEEKQVNYLKKVAKNWDKVVKAIK